MTKRKKVINKGDTWKLRDPEPGLLGNTALVMSPDCPSHHTSICLSVICEIQVADSCSESGSQAGDSGAQEYRVHIVGAQGGYCAEQ